METNTRISLQKAFEKDQELTTKFAKNKASIEDINLLAERSRLHTNFITVNLSLVRQLAQGI